MNPRTRVTLMSGLSVALVSTALSSVYADNRWMRPTLAAIAVAGLVGWIGRRVGAPILAAVFVAPAALLELLGWLYARSTLSGHVLPTGRTITALRDLARAAFSDVRTLAAPVQTTPRLIMLAVAGVFAIAVLTDALAATASRASLAGLPLLALFATPAAISAHGVGALSFLAGSSGWVALLLVEGRERVGRWGRALAGGGRDRSLPGGGGSVGLPTDDARASQWTAGSPLGATGRRIGSAAVCLAAVVPLALPSPHGGLLDRITKGSGQGGGGGGSATVFPPLVTLEQRLHSTSTTELLTVETATPTYLRMTALDSFDGRQFTLEELRASSSQRVNKGLPDLPYPASTPTTSSTVKVHVSDQLAEPYLPLPYAPVQVSVRGDWRASAPTFTVFSVRTNTRGITYSASAEVPSPDPTTLRASGSASRFQLPAQLLVDADVPPTVSPRVHQLALDLTAKTSTAYDAVLAIQAYLRSSAFHYSLNTPQPSSLPDPLSTFLFSSRTGYCEQFASAMTVLVRELGLPARVAIGFTSGTLGTDALYHVTDKDAHAWPEVWFPTAGWVRFEPTPLSNGQAQIPSYASVAGPGTQGPGGGPSPTPAGPTATPSTSRGQPASERLEQQDARNVDAAPTPRSIPATLGPLGFTLLGLVLLLLAAAPGAARLLVRRHRISRAREPVEPAEAAIALSHAAWSELLDTCEDLRLPVPGAESPRVTAGRILALPGVVMRRGDADPVAVSMRRLLSIEERARYARSAPDTSDVAVVLKELATVRAALVAATPRVRRLRARLAPPSVIRRASTATAATVADVLDAVDRAVAAVSKVPGFVVRRLAGART